MYLINDTSMTPTDAIRYLRMISRMFRQEDGSKAMLADVLGAGTIASVLASVADEIEKGLPV